MIIDWNKPVQTRDGRKVRVLCTDKKGASPVVALVEHRGKEVIGTFDEHGRKTPWSEGCGADLINVPERTERWMNIYPGVGGSLYGSKDIAEVNRTYRRTGLLKLTYENGRLVAVELVEGGDA